MDGIVFKVREKSNEVNKTIYRAVGLNGGSHKEILGMWPGNDEDGSLNGSPNKPEIPGRRGYADYSGR